MSAQKSPSKIAKRFVLVVMPLALIHLGAITLWSFKSSNRMSDDCVSLGFCGVQPWTLSSPLGFYHNGDATDWVLQHIASLVILGLLAIVTAFIVGGTEWIATGRSWMADPEEEVAGSDTADDFIPCKNPQCLCVSHQNEEFVTEWIPKN